MDGGNVNLRRDLAVRPPERVCSGGQDQQYQHQKKPGARLL